jgi:hypothetical protein
MSFLSDVTHNFFGLIFGIAFIVLLFCSIIIGIFSGSMGWATVIGITSLICLAISRAFAKRGNR